MEDRRIKDKKNRKNFEHNLPRPIHTQAMYKVAEADVYS